MPTDPVATAADRYLHGAYHPNGQCPNGMCAEPTTGGIWDARPMFASDADVTVYWPDVRPCYEEQAASPETPECRPCPPSGVTLGT